MEAKAQEAKERERVHLALLDWLLAGDTSLAEHYLIKVALGIDTPVVYPTSYPEFAGCYKLFDAVLIDCNMPLMKDRGWVKILSNWDKLWAKEVTLKDVLGDRIP
jgi:hypothetical protein